MIYIRCEFCYNFSLRFRMVNVGILMFCYNLINEIFSNKYDIEFEIICFVNKVCFLLVYICVIYVFYKF